MPLWRRGPIIRDEGTSLPRRPFLNFTGAGVTATDDAGSGETDVTIAGGGGGGGATATTVEVDLGATPVVRGRFTITDGAISASSKVLVWQAPGPYTGKGTLADEAEMDPLSCVGVYPGSGQAIVEWQSALPGAMPRRLPGGNPVRSGLSVFTPYQDNPQSVGSVKAGRPVRGNFKFTYVVFS